MMLVVAATAAVAFVVAFVVVVAVAAIAVATGRGSCRGLLMFSVFALALVASFNPIAMAAFGHELVTPCESPCEFMIHP